VVLVLLVAMVVWGVVQYGGTHRTPHGGTMPQAEQGPTVMPANNQPLPGNEPQNTMPPTNSAG
jgi:hypothetical protein